MHRNRNLRSIAAPAKLNLYLQVFGHSSNPSPAASGNRHDYHQIESLAVFTWFGDRLEVDESPTISLQVEGPFKDECGPLETNLVLRAAHALAAFAPTPVGAALKLHKYLPAASGLGGGSSDAAAAIQLLISFWELDIDEQTLAALALNLGADVPVCLRRRPAIMRGIGDQLSAGPKLPNCYVLLVNPRIPLSTRAVFEKLDGRFSKAAQRFPRHVSSAKKLARLLAARNNDLQQPAIELVPEIQTVLDALARQNGCLLSCMSGSGSTCFGLFNNAEQMAIAAMTIRRDHPEYWQAQTRFG